METGKNAQIGPKLALVATLFCQCN